MTREEAIKLLCVEKSIIIEVDGNKGAEKMLQAYDMAIEALSAEAAIGDYPNDLIRRSALMEYCSNQKSKSIDNNDIARFPSAEAVEVVRCKDCIRTRERDEYTGRLWCSIHRGYMEDAYYCADGFRRGDDET